MYCKACGSEIKDGAKFCPVCGKNSEENVVVKEVIYDSNSGTVPQNDKLGLLYGILSIVLPSPIGLVLGIMSLKISKKYRVLAIIGIILSIIGTIFIFFSIIYRFSFFFRFPF
ncbi:MAG TPA: zinc ribbon domain-containing protein [Candidatus Onthovivens sp.]|nr:zinc ribbon domain-containing protein [Candidatus Onthovivens sp.]